MLEIFVNGRKFTLNSDTSITLVLTNPLFESGGIPTPYSLTYSVPKSPNLSIIEYGNRIASKFDYKAKLPTVISFGGIEIAKGVQTIESIDDDSIELSFNGVILPDTSKLKLPNIDLLTLELARATNIREPDPETGLVVDKWDTSGSPTVYANLLQAEMSKDYPTYAAPTMTIQGSELIVDDEATEAKPTYVNERATSVNSCYHGPNKSKLLLSVNVGYIIGKIFPNIKGVFDNGDFKRLMVLGTYHPKYQIEDDNQAWDVNKTTGYVYVKLQDFMPDVPFDEFLCNVLKLPCASIYIVDGKPVVEYNKDIINRTQTLHWDNKIVGTPQISCSDGERYSIGYSDIESEEIPPETPIYEDNTIEQMVNPTVIVEGDAVYDGLYLRVLSTGQIFKTVVNSALSTDTKIFYDYQFISDEPERPAIEDDARAEFDMVFSGSAVRMGVAVDVQQDAKMKPSFTGAFPNHHRVYCPQFEYDADSKSQRPDKLIVGLWLGIRPSITSSSSQQSFGYPLLSKYNRTPYGATPDRKSVV